MLMKKGRKKERSLQSGRLKEIFFCQNELHGMLCFICFKGGGGGGTDIHKLTNQSYLQSAFIGCVNVFIASFQFKLALFPFRFHLSIAHAIKRNVLYNYRNKNQIHTFTQHIPQRKGAKTDLCNVIIKASIFQFKVLHTTTNFSKIVIHKCGLAAIMTANIMTVLYPYRSLFLC